MDNFIARIFCLASFVIGSFAADPYFWHITDPHIDPTYYGDQESCNEDVSNPGKFGSYECDAPYELIKAAMAGMKTHGRMPEFIIYTGDNPQHPKNRSTSVIDHDFILASLRNVTDLINSTFPDVRLVVSLGNHDYYPKDQLPGQTNPLYTEVAEMWRPWIGDDAVSTFRTGAYYTTLLDPDLKLRAVVVNTNLYLSANDVTSGQTDPAGQYVWLEGVLGSARTAQEKVHIIAHVPTGVMPADGAPTWLRESDNAKFIGIIREYSDVIVGYYSCHEHLDSFRLIYNDQGEAVVPMFVAPSITPWKARISSGQIGSAHNPGLRIISYSSYTGHLTDLNQYYLDLPRANQDGEAVWRSLYRMRALYGIDNITATALHELSETFKLFGNNDFHNYYDMSSVGAKGVDVPPCSCDCKFRHICAIQNMEYDKFQECYDAVACGVAGLSYSIWALIFTLSIYTFFEL